MNGTLSQPPVITNNYWTNASGGDWDTATNWSLGHVPTATENAVITLAGTYTVTHLQNYDGCW